MPQRPSMTHGCNAQWSLPSSPASAAKTWGGRFKSVLATGGDIGSVANLIAASTAGMGPAGMAVSAVATGVGMLANVMGDAQQAASDLNEQQAKLGEVFDASAGDIRAWAEGAATSMGLSTRAALEAAGTFGNFLQAMGTSEAESAKFSTSLVQVAADLASFNNAAGGAEEVLGAIQSGLSGETEPMRRFGVDISDVAVQAELAAQGIQKVGGAYTQSQKIQARYAIIMRQTATALLAWCRVSNQHSFKCSSRNLPLKLSM
jgi:hypothetical protein